ncbi:MAG: beta-galactosidase [Planctomycetota bacterium]
MATVSFDGQTLSVDGQRVWLVGGTMHYLRMPRGLWRDRVRAARDAGLNTVEVVPVWSEHEREPGRFDFAGDRDLRGFVELLAEEGFWVTLRAGPVVGGGWSFGGVPPFVLRYSGTKKDGVMRLRQVSMPFMEAVARYFGEMVKQVADLQVSTPLPGRPPKRPGLGNPAGRPAGGFRGQGQGPVLAVQAEHRWYARHPDQHDGYLRQVVRYLRENGIEVPILNTNNLWQPIDGSLSGWNDAGRLAAHARQLATLQPEAPRLITGYTPFSKPIHGAAEGSDEGTSANADPQALTTQLAQAMGVGAQVNLDPFFHGVTPGHTAGRAADQPAGFLTPTGSNDCPVLPDGSRTAAFQAVRRVNTFASQFHHVLGALEPTYQPTVVDPVGEEQPVSVMHQTGTMGDLLVLISPSKPRTAVINVLLPTGQALPVPINGLPAAWLLTNALLTDQATLDYTNVSPWALIDRKLLVVYGPPKADALLSINGAPLQLTVPSGKTPVVESHEELTIVLLNPDQLDAATLTEDGLLLGAQPASDDDGDPTPLPGWSTRFQIALDGTVSQTRQTTPKKPTAPKLTGWSIADCNDFLTGEAEAFEESDKTTPAQLSHDAGYGWYRLPTTKASGAGSVIAPLAGDRVHLYAKAKPLGSPMGLGPGATADPIKASVPAGPLVGLVDLIARPDSALELTPGQPEPLGLPFGVHSVKPVKLPKPDVLDTPSPDPFAVTGFAPGYAASQGLPANSLQWSIKPANRKPILVRIHTQTARGVFFVNDEPLAIIPGHRFHADAIDLVLDPADDGPFTGGTNTLRFALSEPLTGSAESISNAVSLSVYQLTGPIHDPKKPIGFAPLTVPPDDAFAALAATAKPPALPAWFAAEFTTPAGDRPLHLNPQGLSKGLVYLNGHLIARYWNADPAGKPVLPQTPVYLPEPCLLADATNRLMIFDEHGKHPGKARLILS